MCINFSGDLNSHKYDIISHNCHGKRGTQEWIFHFDTVRFLFNFFSLKKISKV